jgi:hypothetical protein
VRVVSTGLLNANDLLVFFASVYLASPLLDSDFGFFVALWFMQQDGSADIRYSDNNLCDAVRSNVTYERFPYRA